ncbi:hypothetical protein [Flagellimonas lutaonensis]|uniref:hypothetical protein n=1 Tax=Flagellimonas lutaonensis TaxID=516051 RepID=UPI0005F77891|nr:hypothetical protein [Allomuricauda lutaonensis]
MKEDTWSILAFIAVVVSQILIFMSCKDTIGTIANVIIPVGIIGLASDGFENTYKKDVLSLMEKSYTDTELLSKKNLKHLTQPV